MVVEFRDLGADPEPEVAPEDFIWTTGDGERMRLGDCERYHRDNILNFLVRRRGSATAVLDSPIGKALIALRAKDQS